MRLLSKLIGRFRRTPAALAVGAEVLAPEPIKYVMRGRHYCAVERRWEDAEVTR